MKALRAARRGRAEWTMVHAVFDGSRNTLLVNGVEVGGVSDARALAPVAFSPLIGISDPPANYGAFNGVIDELALYDRALTRTEILEHVAAR